MAEWTTNKMLKEALELIEEDDNVLFFDDLCAVLGVSRPTFYKYIKKGSEEYKKIDKAIQRNKIKVKKYIRLKLRVSGKAAELLALYRMICTDEERRAINQQYVEMSGNVDNHVQIEFVSGSGTPLAHSEDEVDTERK